MKYISRFVKDDYVCRGRRINQYADESVAIYFRVVSVISSTSTQANRARSFSNGEHSTDRKHRSLNLVRD